MIDEEKRNTQLQRRQRLTRQMICLRDYRGISEISSVACAIMKMKVLFNNLSLSPVLHFLCLSLYLQRTHWLKEHGKNALGPKDTDASIIRKMQWTGREKDFSGFLHKNRLLFPISIVMVSWRLWPISCPSTVWQAFGRHETFFFFFKCNTISEGPSNNRLNGTLLRELKWKIEMYRNKRSV